MQQWGGRQHCLFSFRLHNDKVYGFFFSVPFFKFLTASSPDPTFTEYS